jgi:hypothetical protein
MELEASPLWLQLCAVETIGRLQVVGFGFDDNQRQSRTYVNAGLRLRGSVPLAGALRGAFAVGAETPVVRESFRFGTANGQTTGLFSMSPVVGVAQLGLALWL